MTPWTPPCSSTCAGMCMRAGSGSTAPTNGSIRRRVPSAPHGFRPCTGPGSTGASRLLDATLSSVLADHVAWGTGRLECYLLPPSYLCLLPLVGTA